MSAIALRHNEGKKGRSFSGKKALPVFLICLAVLLALIWVIQLIWVKDGYRILKTQMAKSVLHDVCENIDSFDLSVLNIELTSAKIGVKIVDAQGETLVEAGSFHNASLTEYTQEKLAELYRQAESTRGVAWEQVMRFHTVYCKSQDPVQRDYQVLTCAQIAQTAQGEKRMVLLSAEVTPSLILEKMLRLQGMVFSLPLLLLIVVVAVIHYRRRLDDQALLVQSLELVAQGDFEVHFPDTKRLGRALNQVVKQFVRTEQQNKEMLANISHDLRSPLTMIIGYTQMMQDMPEENTPENVQVIQDEAQRLSLLVNDILDLSRMQSGQMKLNLQVFCLTDILQRTVERYQKLLGEDYQICLEQNCRVWVKADELEISRVIYNFINNACHHTGEDKQIVVRQVLDGKKVRVRVCDHGEGIPEENLSKIWDRYYRVNKSSAAKKVPGNGLGLCIVKEILQAHHARYGVESQLGEGSTFWFELEVWDQELTQK